MLFRFQAHNSGCNLHCVVIPLVQCKPVADLDSAAGWEQP